MDVQRLRRFEASNASCYEASSENLSDQYWQVFFHPDFAGKAGTGPLIMFFIIGVPLNLYIITAILIKRLNTQPTYLLLLNLGIIHLVTCFIPIFFGIVIGLRGEVWFGSSDYFRCLFCKIFTVYLLVTFAEVLNMALLSMERLAFFLSPVEHKNSLTYRRMAFVLVLIWLTSFVLIIPPILGYGDASFAMWCGLIFLSQAHLARALAYFLIGATIPLTYLIIVVASNLGIMLIAIRSSYKVKRSRIIPDSSKVSRIMIGDSEQIKLAYKRRMSRILASKQIHLYQVYFIHLLVNIFTLFPLLALAITSSANRSSVEPEFVVIAQVLQLSQVVIHPAIVTVVTPELSKMILFNCTRCCPRLRYNTIGNTIKAGHRIVGKCCWPRMWAKALENEIMNMYNQTVGMEQSGRYFNYLNSEPVVP